MIRRTLIATALALALTASAHADTPLHRAVRIADARWPDSPCHGRERLQFDSAAVRYYDRGAYGFAVPETCTVVLDWGMVRPLSMRMKCRLLTHEFGHLAGERHSDDSRSVMFPVLLDTPHNAQRCAFAFHQAIWLTISLPGGDLLGVQ